MSFTGASAGPPAGEPAPAVHTVVTTALDPEPDQRRRASRLARELGARVVPRDHVDLETLAERARPAGAPEGSVAVLVVERQGLSVRAGGVRLVYHPGMALHRVRRLAAGGQDPMVRAMGLQPGDRVVDATLGLGSDALVAAWAAGPQGRVVGLEKVPVLAVLVREGLKSYPWPEPQLAEAARRIRVEAADHMDYLGRLAPGSVDVVYFDAMFERGLRGSAAMAGWRTLAWPGAIGPGAIELARRAARRRVVLKDRRDSTRLNRLSPAEVQGSRSSRVVFAIWPGGALGNA